MGEPERARGRAWAVQQALGLAWYYEAASPAMAAPGRRARRRLVTSE